jgi:hypothetical protein
LGGAVYNDNEPHLLLESEPHGVFKIIDDMPNEGDFAAAVHETMIHGVAEWHDQAWHDFIINDPWHFAGTANC